MSGRQKGKGWVCRKITSISEQGEWSKYLINILSVFTRSFAVCLLFFVVLFNLVLTLLLMLKEPDRHCKSQAANLAEEWAGH